MGDFEVTESKEFSDYLTMAHRLSEGYAIDIAASDDNASYGKFLISRKHIITKSETALVECYNSLLRHYLARFHRKTKRYSKAVDMMKDSVLLLFNNLGRMSITYIFS